MGTAYRTCTSWFVCFIVVPHHAQGLNSEECGTLACRMWSETILLSEAASSMLIVPWLCVAASSTSAERSSAYPDLLPLFVSVPLVQGSVRVRGQTNRLHLFGRRLQRLPRPLHRYGGTAESEISRRQSVYHSQCLVSHVIDIVHMCCTDRSAAFMHTRHFVSRSSTCCEMIGWYRKIFSKVVLKRSRCQPHTEANDWVASKPVQSSNYTSKYYC